MILFRICFAGFLVYSLAGCGAGPAPRLLDLVGHENLESKTSPVESGVWPQFSKIGMMVYSDATAEHAAPAITEDYLETLARRTEEFLRKHCAVQDVVPLVFIGQPVDFSRELQAMGKRFQLSHLFLVVLSSHERSGPEKMGEATMMTQLSGSVTENSALAEVGIFHLSPFRLFFSASGKGIEILEQLDAPIGNTPSFTTTAAHDILRARAGQQALDRALERVGSACKGANRPAGVTGSFQIAGQARNPAP